MISCVECGSRISDKARVCPKCGIERGSRAPVRVGSQSGGVVLVMLFLLAFAGYWYVRDYNERKAAEARAEEEHRVAEARAELLRRVQAECRKYCQTNCQALNWGMQCSEQSIFMQNCSGACLAKSIETAANLRTLNKLAVYE